MTKFAELQEKILLADKEELKHTLGYTNDDAFNKTIEHITKANSLKNSYLFNVSGENVGQVA